MPSSARKKGKKAAKPEPPCSAAEFSAVKEESFTNHILDYLAEKNHSLAGPRPDSDALGSATSAVASVEDEENPSATSAKATVNDPTSDDEEPSSSISPKPSSYREVPYGREIPKPKTKLLAQKRTNGRPFTAADLERYLFQAMQDSEDGEIAVPLHVDFSARRIHTEKLVKFFRDNTGDKHFVEIPVEPLRGKENWREWLVAMQLLLIQHGIWEVVVKDATMPLAKTHPLFYWYQRMRHCAVGLIYVHVSDFVRKQPCFLSAIAENDPDSIMTHLFAHYSEAEENCPHANSSTHHHQHQSK